MIGISNCEPQLDVIQKRISFMYQTVVKKHVNCYRCSAP